MPTPHAEVAKHRAAQARVADLVRDQLRALFASLNLSKPEDARNVLLAVTPELVRQYGDMASTVAADAYDEWRRLGGVAGRYAARVFDSPYLDAVEKTVRRAAGGLWTDNPKATLVSLSGPVAKYVLAAGRETMTRNADADPQSSGWMREVSPGGCDFCAMLADRGNVYSEAGVHFAAHDDCNCSATPSWDSDVERVSVDAYKASERTSAMTPEQKAAHNARVRDWLSQNA